MGDLVSTSSPRGTLHCGLPPLPRQLLQPTKIISAKLPHGTVWGGLTPFSLHQGPRMQPGAWQEGGIWAAQAVPHPYSTSLFQESQTLPLSWRSTSPGPGSLKHCFHLEVTSWSPFRPQWGQPLSQDAGVASPRWPGALSYTPTRAVFPHKEWQLGAAGGSRPPHQYRPGWDGSPLPGDAQTAEPSEPAAGRTRAGSGSGGRPGSSAGRRGRRRTRGAYCW